VILFSVVRKITASIENRRELLGDKVMKTASHRNGTLQATLIKFEQLLQGRKWEFVFTSKQKYNFRADTFIGKCQISKFSERQDFPNPPFRRP